MGSISGFCVGSNATTFKRSIRCTQTLYQQTLLLGSTSLDFGKGGSVGIGPDGRVWGVLPLPAQVVLMKALPARLNMQDNSTTAVSTMMTCCQNRFGKNNADAQRGLAVGVIVNCLIAKGVRISHQAFRIFINICDCPCSKYATLIGVRGLTSFGPVSTITATGNKTRFHN